MIFAKIKPDGTTERLQHVAYTVRQTAPSEWRAYTIKGRLLARDRRSESHLRAVCDSIAEPVSGAAGLHEPACGA